MSRECSKSFLAHGHLLFRLHRDSNVAHKDRLPAVALRNSDLRLGLIDWGKPGTVATSAAQNASREAKPLPDLRSAQTLGKDR
jgi:hypothetical protein